MNRATERSINRIADRARARYGAWIDAARRQTADAAGRVVDGKKPVKKLSRLGRKLTTVSHKATSQILDQQTKMLENQIDAVADRLRAASSANSLTDLVRGQFARVPKDASQFLTDARGTISIVADAGSEMRTIIVGTVKELRGTKAKAKPKAAAKTTAKKKAKTKTRKAAKASTADTAAQAA